MPLPALLARLINWVREGYPEGVPERDYLPLFALLARRLTPDEMTAVVVGLTHGHQLPADTAEEAAERARDAIEAVTKSPPSDQDVERVLRRLEAAGWDLDTAETTNGA